MSSSWISSIYYHSGYLVLFLRSDDAAMVYSGVPPWVPGLLAAGTGRRSIGLAYNRLVKGKYTYQRIDKLSRIRELQQLIQGDQ